MSMAKADPAISVLIPAYNAEPYVAEALESVLAQTLPPAEIVVFDDGSSDGTFARLLPFGERIRLLGPKRRGFAQARNFLLGEARHPWIAFHDADDLWVCDKLEKQVAWLAANPGHDACIGLAEQFVQPGATLPRTFRRQLIGEPSAQLFIPNLLAPLSIFERIGPFDIDITHGAESDWFVRARDAGVRIGTVPEVLYRRRWHESNLCYAMDFRDDMLSVLRRSVARKRGSDARKAGT